MKEKINKINQLIGEKRNRLKEKAERSFEYISTLLNNTTNKSEIENKKKGIPPISYILYGIAGVTVVATEVSLVLSYVVNQKKEGDSSFLSSVSALVSDSSLPYLFGGLGVAALCVGGGYMLSKQKDTAVSSAPYTQNKNFDSLKSEVTFKVIESVKKITNEWEDFMELQQKVVQNAIDTSSLNDSDKDSLQSKVFIYEVIDIRLSDFSSMINSVSKQSDIKTQLDLYKSKLLSAIDAATIKQINKYNSII